MPLIEVQNGGLFDGALNLEDSVDFPETVQSCIAKIDVVEGRLEGLTTVVEREEEWKEECDEVVGDGPSVQLLLDSRHQVLLYNTQRLSVVLETEGLMLVMDQRSEG